MKNDEAAEYLGLKPGTLPVWRHSGIGPGYVKVGRNVRYRKADLDRYLETRVVKTVTSRS